MKSNNPNQRSMRAPKQSYVSKDPLVGAPGHSPEGFKTSVRSAAKKQSTESNSGKSKMEFKLPDFKLPNMTPTKRQLSTAVGIAGGVGALYLLREYFVRQSKKSDVRAESSKPTKEASKGSSKQTAKRKSSGKKTAKRKSSRK